MQTVTLNQTGIQVSRLAFGTGSDGWQHASNQTRIGFEPLVNLIRFAYERGVTFWDSADQYGSHPHFGRALNFIPRTSVVITTKTTSVTAEGARADLDRFRRELNTDYLDIVLLHCMTQGDWPTRYAGAMDVLSEAKQQGIVKAVGVSCHDINAFRTAAETDWVEVVLARINYAQKHMDASPDEVIQVMERMHALGKGIYGMKVFGNGDLAHDPEKALRYVMNLRCVDALTLGMTSESEVTEGIQVMEMLEREAVPA